MSKAEGISPADARADALGQAPAYDAVVALGSNIGDKAANIARAIAELTAAGDIRLVAASADYRTAPWGITDQDWFVNACILVATDLPPLDLLDRCLAVERVLGRERQIKWGPRIIDVDVLVYRDVEMATERLTLPHPYMTERSFVLRPLADIAAGLVVRGRTVAEWLTLVPHEDVVALSPSAPPAVSIATRLRHAGRDPADHNGFVNTPAYRGSTVLFPTLDALTRRDQPYTYGRRGNPNTTELETQIAALEGGTRTILTASGLQAVTTAILALVEAGDDILVTDSVYQPTRAFCDKALANLGVRTTYYDPTIGAGIAALIGPRTKLVLTESPGSQTFEMQDISAIAAATHAKGALVVMDNTWASPLYFRPFDHGVDLSIQSLTKYVVGHSDALLGAVTANARTEGKLIAAREALGVCPGSEETWLALRGLRTLDIRLARHHTSGLEVATWLASRPEVAEVLHPALPSHPGHALWKRDFTGASGLFSVVLHPASRTQVAAFVDHLRYFGMGYSWGGYESLVIPFDPRAYRTATKWDRPGPCLRFHIGLEDPADLIADLAAGFDRLNAAAG